MHDQNLSEISEDVMIQDQLVSYIEIFTSSTFIKYCCNCFSPVVEPIIVACKIQALQVLFTPPWSTLLWALQTSDSAKYNALCDKSSMFNVIVNISIRTSSLHS